MTTPDSYILPRQHWEHADTSAKSTVSTGSREPSQYCCVQKRENGSSKIQVPAHSARGLPRSGYQAQASISSSLCMSVELVLTHRVIKKDVSHLPIKWASSGCGIFSIPPLPASASDAC